MLIKQQKGFTLIESIITIIIIGIVASTVSLIIGNYLENYDATSRRTKMQTSAQLAIERISREVRNALPNSVCIPDDAGTNCIPTTPATPITRTKVAFIKIIDAGYYQDTSGDYPDNTSHRVLPVSPAAASDQFDIVSGTDLRVQVDDHVAVYNINNSSIYTGNNLSKVTSVTPMNIDGVAGDDIIRLEINSKSFPLHSPQRRVHIIESNTTIFYLDGTDLKLGKSANFENVAFNPTVPASSYLLLQNVTNLSFNFDSGGPQRAGLLHIDLTVEDQGEQIHIIHEAHVYNVP
ncbi:MAG: prepilin-type N-terminal cleavage/methylation domain-containing protein [Gammaproteobacteria bacterium]|nr:prepilin-type N-terminal cleavage/methylation domain-containing protein [Gammaproteobacteria bacterium]MCW8986706.1 prepilin-type N-terminal cleavage/methylation domain-containing protein [Gammaproteobacteria bacterium]MCW9032508.1 prepilin-type N-terminal cleavage/methylation domain-containing protein [Gammaproteobacteria bacterium]